jgi:hypothetical protein
MDLKFREGTRTLNENERAERGEKGGAGNIRYTFYVRRKKEVPV